MTDDLHSIVSRLESLDEELAGINADRASVFQDAKKIKLDLPALRLVVAERRRRAKNPAAYEALQGTAADYRDALDNGVIIGHARAPAHARPTKSEAPPICEEGEREGSAVDGPRGAATQGAADATANASDTLSSSTTGSALPPAGNDAPRPSAAAPSPVVETKPEDGDGIAQAATPPASNINALSLEKGGEQATPDDGLNIPAFLDRTTEQNQRIRAGAAS